MRKVCEVGGGLSNAYLRGVNLKCANLQGVNLSGANFEGTVLDWAIFDGAFVSKCSSTLPTPPEG